MFFTGTASVIIALTDGELNTNQFITAQQEASKQTSDSFFSIFTQFWMALKHY